MYSFQYFYFNAEAITNNVVTLCTGGSQIKSLEEGQKSERRNLEQQHHQHWMELDQSNNDSHIQLDNGNVSWKSNIDSDYELDSLRLARDGGILDWDDRVVDVLDDRELTNPIENQLFLLGFMMFSNQHVVCMKSVAFTTIPEINQFSIKFFYILLYNETIKSYLIVNFRRKLPTSLPNTLIHPNELPYSSCNHRKSPQNESVLFTNDDSLVRNQSNLSTSVNNSSLAPSSSSLFKITSSPLSLTVCSPSVTGRILCDTGVTYVQLPYPQRQQQTFQIIAPSSSSVDVTYSTPQRSQFYSDHQQISPLSRRGCLEESCDCFCLTESDINAKETMFPKDNEVKLNQTGHFQNIKPTGYNQYTSHPITTLIVYNQQKYQ
ncbi:partitioning defective 3 [Schistosoma japonicum]|nr:partitioning defective 3 [Schistosoma japonicum]